MIQIDNCKNNLVKVHKKKAILISKVPQKTEYIFQHLLLVVGDPGNECCFLGQIEAPVILKKIGIVWTLDNKKNSICKEHN